MRKAGTIVTFHWTGKVLSPVRTLVSKCTFLTRLGGRCGCELSSHCERLELHVHLGSHGLPLVPMHELLSVLVQAPTRGSVLHPKW